MEMYKKKFKYNAFSVLIKVGKINFLVFDMLQNKGRRRI